MCDVSTSTGCVSDTDNRLLMEECTFERNEGLFTLEVHKSSRREVMDLQTETCLQSVHVGMDNAWAFLYVHDQALEDVVKVSSSNFSSIDLDHVIALTNSWRNEQMQVSIVSTRGMKNAHTFVWSDVPIAMNISQSTFSTSVVNCTFKENNVDSVLLIEECV